MTNITKPYFSRTDMTKNCKYSRLCYKIESRLLYFTEQVEFRGTSPYYEKYVEKLKEFNFIAQNHLCKIDIDGNYFNYNKTVDKVNNKAGIGDSWTTREYHYREAAKWVNIWPKRDEHLKEYMGIELPEKYAQNGFMADILAKMAEGAYNTSQQIIKTRIRMQLMEWKKLDRPIIFSTLTVEPEHYDYVFAPGSTAWRYYLRNLKNWIAKEHDGTHGKMHYVTVLEEGDTTGRMHMHCLFFLERLETCADPNKGISNKKTAVNRQIKELDFLWPYGFSEHIPTRWNRNDYWAKLGWQWPIDKESGFPLNKSSVTKLTEYLANYILKSKLNRKELTWRTKMDREMGTNTLTAVIYQLKMKELIALCKYRKTPTRMQIMGEDVPYRLIRGIAVKRMLRWLRTHRNPEALPKDTTLKTLLRNGTGVRLGHKRESFGNILVELFHKEDTSKVFLPHIMTAREKIGEIEL